MKKLMRLFMVGIAIITTFSLIGCAKSTESNESTESNGKYFVNSEYIIATASQTSFVKNSLGQIEYYEISISFDSDIKLDSVKYNCELYSNKMVIEKFEDEVTLDGLYSKFVSYKTTKEYEHAKVFCTGLSKENPKNFRRLHAKSLSQMQQCAHKNMIGAKIGYTQTNNKQDYLVIVYNSNTAYGSFKFFYENYSSIYAENVNVCVDCGYYEELS